MLSCTLRILIRGLGVRTPAGILSLPLRILKGNQPDFMQLTEAERLKYINQILDFLSLQENLNQKFHYDDLANKLNIPKEYQTPVFNKLWSTNYINGEPAIKNPKIWISESGKTYVSNLKEQNQKIGEKREIESKVAEKLNIDLENSRNQLFDYQTTKKRAIRSEYLAIGGLLLSVISILMQLKCN
jgi:hypothetical protein